LGEVSGDALERLLAEFRQAAATFVDEMSKPGPQECIHFRLTAMKKLDLSELVLLAAIWARPRP
jgi:hypothetical protein